MDVSIAPRESRIRRCFASRLWIVPGPWQASQPIATSPNRNGGSLYRASLFTTAHRREDLGFVRFLALFRLQRHFENRGDLIQRAAGTEIQVVPPGLQDAGFSTLMAIHTDVIRQSGG